MSPVVTAKNQVQNRLSYVSYKEMGPGATRTLKTFLVHMHQSVVRMPETPQNVTYVTVASLKFRFPDTLIMRKDP